MAGKAKKAAKAQKRKAMRKSAKEARKSLYASLRGTSKKNKKINKKKTGEARFNTWSPKKHKHLMAKCGNSGCQKCGRN